MQSPVSRQFPRPQDYTERCYEGFLRVFVSLQLSPRTPGCYLVVHQPHRSPQSYPGQPQPEVHSERSSPCYLLGCLYVAIHLLFRSTLSHLNEIPDSNKRAKERKIIPLLYHKGHPRGIPFPRILTFPS